MYDVVIIGQGLAGSLLGYMLHKKGQQVLVIDDGLATSSTKVAAGMINPVMGHRPNRDPLFDLYLEKALHTYHMLENDLGSQLIQARKQIRIFASAEQKQQWLDQAAPSPWLRAIKPESFPQLLMPHGGCLVAFSHVVHTAELLLGVGKFLAKENCLLQQKVQHKEIEIASDGVTIGPIKARQMVFCEGARILQNPLFQHINMKPAKGEILHLKIPDLPLAIYNWGKWLVPIGPGHFKLGSNHVWGPLDHEPQDETREELLQSMQQQFAQPLDYEVLDHQVGIRPASLDRTPFIEVHPKYPHVFCMNGFGSKGCLMMPFFVSEFIDPLGEK